MPGWRLRLRKGALVLALGLVGAVATALPAAGAGPAGSGGNNGTVKIRDGNQAPSSERSQEPKTCTFRVEVFGYDAGQQVSFEVVKKSGRPVLQGSLTVDESGHGRSTDAYALADGQYKLTVRTTSGEPRHESKVFSVRCGTQTIEQEPPLATNAPTDSVAIILSDS
jgi:hypothetical protein